MFAYGAGCLFGWEDVGMSVFQVKSSTEYEVEW